MTRYLNATERPLSPAEQTIWAVDNTCSMNFMMHFELRGPLTEARLQEALSQVQRRHPLLRMRIAEEGLKVWFRTSGVGAIPLRLVDGPAERLTEEAEHEVRTCLDLRHGPLVRCVWIRHSPEHGTILLTFCHVIGDGTSGSLLVRDLLKALAGEVLSVLPLAESLDAHLPAATLGIRGFFSFLRMLTHLTRWFLRRGRPQIVPTEMPAGFDQRRANLVFTRFGPAFTQALIARARAEGTTVHGALSAAIVLSGFPEIGVPKAHVFFLSPLNMRERFDPPIGDDIGFYVAGGISSHDIHSHMDFWSLARELKQGLNAAVDMGFPFHGLTGLAPGLIFLYRLAGGGACGIRAITHGFAASLTRMFSLSNIGRVKLEPHYGPFQVSGLGFVASPSVVETNFHTATSLDDTLCLNSIEMEPLMSRATQLRVAERMRTILTAAIATTAGDPSAQASAGCVAAHLTTLAHP